MDERLRVQNSSNAAAATPELPSSPHRRGGGGVTLVLAASDGNARLGREGNRSHSELKRLQKRHDGNGDPSWSAVVDPAMLKYDSIRIRYANLSPMLTDTSSRLGCFCCHHLPAPRKFLSFIFPFWRHSQQQPGYRQTQASTVSSYYAAVRISSLS